MAGPAHDPARVELLKKLLGSDVCRKLGIYAIPEGFKLSVVIPVYNEVRTLAQVVERVRGTGLPLEIVIVDDGSTDGTRDLLARWADGTERSNADLIVVLHERNQGKGGALRTGFSRCTGDVIVVQDADLEYDPQDFRALLQPIVEDRADVVYGSRFSHVDGQVHHYWHRWGNQLITRLSNWKSGRTLTDVETCYKMVRRELIQQVAPALRERGFGIELELTFKLAQDSRGSASTSGRSAITAAPIAKGRKSASKTASGRCGASPGTSRSAGYSPSARFLKWAKNDAVCRGPATSCGRSARARSFDSCVTISRSELGSQRDPQPMRARRPRYRPGIARPHCGESCGFRRPAALGGESDCSFRPHCARAGQQPIVEDSRTLLGAGHDQFLVVPQGPQSAEIGGAKGGGILLDEDRPAAGPLQTRPDGGLGPQRLSVANQPDLRILGCQSAGHVDGVIDRGIVDDDHIEPAGQIGENIEQTVNLAGQRRFGIRNGNDNAERIVQGSDLKGSWRLINLE